MEEVGCRAVISREHVCRRAALYPCNPRHPHRECGTEVTFCDQRGSEFIVDGSSFILCEDHENLRD